MLHLSRSFIRRYKKIGIHQDDVQRERYFVDYTRRYFTKHHDKILAIGGLQLCEDTQFAAKNLIASPRIALEGCKQSTLFAKIINLIA